MEANAETRDRAPEKGRGASGPGGGPDERLTTVRAIAGKIAHDLNNLLTLLQAYPGLILKALPKGAREAQYIGEIEQTVRDMTRLTQQLLWVSRGGRVAPQPCLLNEIVDQALAQMKDTLPAGMTVEFLPTGQLRRVEAIPEQIVLAVQQVCQNAVDAMGDRGVVRLTTENIHLSGPLSHEVRVEPGDYVRVTVSDSGRGIPDEIRDRIYDPNVSTKKSSGRRGAGLGLAIVRSIMMDHNGYVGFETAAGEGTTFSLYFRNRSRGQEQDYRRASVNVAPS
jgi:signal transduction histidine kinase